MNNRIKQGSREQQLDNQQHQDDLVFFKGVRNPHVKKSIQRDKQSKRERKFERKWNWWLT